MAWILRFRSISKKRRQMSRANVCFITILLQSTIILGSNLKTVRIVAGKSTTLLGDRRRYVDFGLMSIVCQCQSSVNVNHLLVVSFNNNFCPKIPFNYFYGLQTPENCWIMLSLQTNEIIQSRGVTEGGYSDLASFNNDLASFR